MTRQKTKRPLRLLISQRILTPYREDAFYELSRQEGLEILLTFGDRRSKRFSKYASVKQTPRFAHRRLWTLSLVFPGFGHLNQAFFSPGVLWQLMRLRPDVVLTEGTSNILNNLLICSYCLLTRTPYIWWDLGKIRGQDRENRFRRLLYPLIRYFFRRAAVILAYSGYARDHFLAEGIPGSKIVVAGNTLRLEQHFEQAKNRAAEALQLKDSLGFGDKSCFLTVGGMEQAKRFDLLIEAFRRISPAQPGCALILVGDGPELPALKTLAAGHPAIYFAGAQFKNNALYFLMSDVFVLPGLGGLAINEAMAYGLPVIAGPADGTEVDLVRNEKTGFLLSEVTVETLCERMIFLLEHPQQRTEMGVNARSLMEEGYQLKHMIAHICRAVEVAGA